MGGGFPVTPFPMLFLCWEGDGCCGGRTAEEVFWEGGGVVRGGIDEAETGGGGGGWAAGVECGGLLGEAGRGARWGGGVMEDEVEAGGSEEVETTGDRGGACAGGGMDAVLALALALELVLAPRG